MEQGNNENKELIKMGVKAIIKNAMTPFTTMIWTAIATILPYILVGVLVFIVLLCVYFGTLEQIDQVMETSGDLGERLGNAVSLYGFKTNEELDKDEEGKFFEMLDLYKSVFSFKDEELMLISQTLLYEGSNEERIYLSETTNDDNKYDIADKGVFVKFFKNIFTNFQRGFLSTYGGQSQYLKANKNLFINAVALKKCNSLTNGNMEKEKQCYKGYLVAEYNTITDYFVDCGANKFGLFCGMAEPISSEVEEGFLVLPNNFFGESAANASEILDLRNAIINTFSQFSIFETIEKKVIVFEENFRDALSISMFGQLATEDTLHFYYDGYIVNNLKEEYKIRKNLAYDSIELTNNVEDEEEIPNWLTITKDEFAEFVTLYDKDVIEKERKNKKKTANNILDLVETYRDLTYGYSKKEDNIEYLPSKGSGSFAYTTSCNPISSEDLAYFSPPTSSCSVNSCFGVYGGGLTCREHKGIDINAPNGVYSVCDGTVIDSRMYNDNSASAIAVQCMINGKNYTVRYLHMPMSDVNNWKVGYHVSIGQRLGQQGNEGWYWDENGVYRQVGTHLHLDISVNGAYVNPESLVNSCNFNLNCESSRDACTNNGLYYCK